QGVPPCGPEEFGSSCQLTCHCADLASCNADGSCSSCSYRWGGPTCQIQLAKLDPSALTLTQHDTKGSNEAGNAVDGDINTYAWAQNMDNESIAWWRASLGKKLPIHHVNIKFFQGVG
ncbi:hypothetical protein MAR_037660, partial [Mya arenaria]